MVIQTGDGGADASPPSDALVREAVAAQDALDAEGADLARALDALHARQDAFEKNVRLRARALRALPAAHPAMPDLRRRLDVVSRLTPSSGGFFVELFLGCVNVRFMRKSERLSFKAGYEHLKQRLAPLFAVLCVLCLYFRDNRWLHMLFQLALTTYYVALAIRENILRINGSNIKPWWILHHYLTMVSCVLMLTWPNGPSYAQFRTDLHYYGLYNATLQIFQTRYQLARLYTLRSLGMAGEMDVANSDSTQIHWSESMKLLLPLIVLGQVLQFGEGITLFRIYASHTHELQILFLGILFIILFIGNATTTAFVVFEKRKSVPASTSPPPQTPAPVPIPSASSSLPPSTLRARSVADRAPEKSHDSSPPSAAKGVSNSTRESSRIGSSSAASGSAAAERRSESVKPSTLKPGAAVPNRSGTEVVCDSEENRDGRIDGRTSLNGSDNTTTR